MCAEVVLSAAQILGRVDRQPEAAVAKGAELSFSRELRKRRRLVVAALGEALQCLGPEHVDAAAHPAVDRAAFGEAGDPFALELDDAERRLRLRVRDRAGGPGRAVLAEQ